MWLVLGSGRENDQLTMVPCGLVLCYTVDFQSIGNGPNYYSYLLLILILFMDQWLYVLYVYIFSRAVSYI